MENANVNQVGMERIALRNLVKKIVKDVVPVKKGNVNVLMVGKVKSVKIVHVVKIVLVMVFAIKVNVSAISHGEENSVKKNYVNSSV